MQTAAAIVHRFALAWRTRPCSCLASRATGARVHRQASLGHHNLLLDRDVAPAIWSAISR